MKSTLRAIVVLGFSLVTAYSNAQVSATPSAAQIAQFKKLPRAQQEALAKQLGIDMSMLDMLPSSEEGEGVQLQPRPEDKYLMPMDEVNEEDTEKEEDELKPFGYEMFESMQDAFLPNGNMD